MESLIDDIVKSLVKSVKAIQMYSIRHPSAKNFYNPLYEKLSSFFKKHSVLELQIEQFTIQHAGNVVHEDKEKDTSIAFRLFRDGIRNISFLEGLAFEEMLTFIETVSKVSKDTDIALCLWEGDFTHINFYVVEEEEELDYRMPEIAKLDIDYDAKIKELINRENIDLSVSMEPDLTPEELSELRTEIAETEKKSAVPVAITTLISYLKTERVHEIVESLVELLWQRVDNRDFHNAVRIIQTLREYPDIDPMVKFETEQVISSFKDLVNTAPEETFNEFITFFGFFSKKSIPYCVRLMCFVKNERRLSALRNAVAGIAEGDAATFLEVLSSKDTGILTNAIATLALISSKDTFTFIKPLMEHPDPDVRVEIVSALEQMGSPSEIVRYLRDYDSTVRIKSLQALIRMKYPVVCSKLLRNIKSRAFHRLEFAEQKEYFDCLVANGGSKMINQLKSILFKRVLFGRKRYSIMRQLSAVALANIGSEEALEILRSGEKNKNRDIRYACGMSLKRK